MEINRKQAKEAFLAYANQFDMSDMKIRLKAEHTLRVADLCEAIARDIGLSGEETDLAWLLGILHDVGRFEQVRRYQTFIDALSINHAGFGADLLFLEGLVRNYVADNREDKLIEKAVRFHSAFRVPEEFDAREQMFCDILRDADKIDILKVNVETPLEECYNASTEEIRAGAVTPLVYEQFLEGHAIPRALKKTVADQIVSQVSLVFELVYPISRIIVKKQGFLEKLMDFPSDNEGTRQKFEEIKQIMNKFMEKNKIY